MSNSMLDKLDAEIAELDEQVYGVPEGDEKGDSKVSDKEGEEEVVEEITEDPIPEEDTIPEEDPIEGEPEPTDIEDGSDPDEEDEPKPKKRRSWKQEYLDLDKRYKGLRNSRDTKTYQATQRVITLTNQVAILTGEITSLKSELTDTAEKVDIYKDLFSEEEIDVVGQDAVDMMKRTTAKAVESAVNPLKEQLAKSKMDAVEVEVAQANTLKQQQENEFYSRLESVIPDYRILDVDPAFNEYVNGFDEVSGLQRIHLLKQAQQYGDVYRVAQFFNDFKATKTQGLSKLEEKIIPGSKKDASIVDTKSNKPKIITMKEYGAFMDKLTRDGFRNNPKEGERLEAYYDKAFSEGRIR